MAYRAVLDRMSDIKRYAHYSVAVKWWMLLKIFKFQHLKSESMKYLPDRVYDLHRFGRRIDPNAYPESTIKECRRMADSYLKELRKLIQRRPTKKPT